jgi:hypothetical protein
VDTSGTQLNKKQNVDRFEPNGFHSEEIASDDLILVVPQEGSPGTRRSLMGRCEPMLLQDISDGRGT